MKETDLIDFLKSYSVNKRFVDAQKYAKDFLDKYGTMTFLETDERLAKMKVVEDLIELLNPSEEHTLLHLHYIVGLPIEKCAECMYMSRSTAFRLVKKAHKTLCEKFTKKEDNNQ